MIAADSLQPSSQDAATDIREYFFEQCCCNIDHLYPEWTRNGYGNHPICIPDSLDVNETWIKQSDSEIDACKSKGQKDTAGLLKGQKREKRTHAALQVSRVGGFAVFDFNPFQFCSQFNIYQTEGDSQIDAILFHPQLGMCILETKSSVKGVEDAEEKEQLKKHEETLRNLYNKVSLHYNNDTLPISSFYCIPMDKSKHSWQKSKDGMYYMIGNRIVLDKQIFKNEETFAQFWDQKMKEEELKGLNKNYFCDENFIRFVKILAGYRSHEYISMGSNVFTIHRQVDKIGNPSETIPSNVDQLIFLTGKQKAIIEEESSVQIIFGVPGSGKTLILLTKILQAAKQPQSERKGKVFVIGNSRAMHYKFSPIINRQKEHYEREIIFIANCSNKKWEQITIDDDLFVDESSWEEFKSNWMLRINMIKTNNGTGKTVIVITDNNRPGAGSGYDFVEQYTNIVDEAKAFIKLQNQEDWCLSQLSVCIRCTGAILDQWKSLFIGKKAMNIGLGHNILGSATKPAKIFKVVNELCQEIQCQIQYHLCALPDRPTLQMSDIAVLLAFGRWIDIGGLLGFVNNLDNQNVIQNSTSQDSPHITYGMMNSQYKDCSCVAVDYADAALSCEWPLVIAVELEHPEDPRYGTEDHFKINKHLPLVARSRAIAKLIIVKRDF